MSRNDCSGGQARSIDVKRPPGSTSRNTAILRILTILVAVLLFAGIYSSYQICPYVNPRKGHYEVKITMSATSNFEMIVPEPVNESYELWDLVQSLTIKEGTASWQVVETFQGLGLRIAGEGNTTLRCEDLQDALPYYVLSPQNRSVSEWDSDHVPLLVYVNASRLEYMLGLSISASYQSRWMDLWTTLGSEPGDLVAGWQVIEGRQNLSVV